MSEPSRSLLAEIADQRNVQTGPQCTIARALRTLNPADAADLATALAGGYTNKQIAAGLRGRDIAISHVTVGRHRRHDCLCPSSTT